MITLNWANYLQFCSSVLFEFPHTTVVHSLRWRYMSIKGFSGVSILCWKAYSDKQKTLKILHHWPLVQGFHGFPWWRHQMETFSAWPFVRGIHRSPVNSPHKGQWRGALMIFYLRLNKRLSKQSWGWWFETLSRSLWRHRNARKEPVMQKVCPCLCNYIFVRW